MIDNIKYRIPVDSIFVILLIIILSACSPTTVYMVRHAEKANPNSYDPILTTDGKQRAIALRRVLMDASIDAIIVSDLQRTQLTAQPLANHLGLKPVVIALKSPANSEQYVQNVVNEIKNNWTGNDVLVVSHTTLLQQIAEKFNGPEIGIIDESRGYDNLFVLIIPRLSQTSKFVRARYGSHSP